MLSGQIKQPNLYKRQKLLLELLRAFGGNLPNIDMQKYLFLFTNICEQKPSYEFVPYRFGCFSFQSYADRRKLIEFGLLKECDGWEASCEAYESLDFAKKANLFAKKFSKFKGNDLVRLIYRDYPYYAINSEIADQLMSKGELEAIDKARPSESSSVFFTIGYEGQSFENYLNRLLKNNVRLLCDVRKNPLSRKYGFSKKTLSETLCKLGIKYIHIPQLGINSDKRRMLNTMADYRALFAQYEVTTLRSEQESLSHLIDLANEHQRVAITCFEAEHCMCHRSKVAEHLAASPDWSHPILHI